LVDPDITWQRYSFTIEHHGLATWWWEVMDNYGVHVKGGNQFTKAGALRKIRRYAKGKGTL
jgi:hypothetical protein